MSKTLSIKDAHDANIQVVEGQTYYFKVSGARGTTGDYILDISPVADDVGSSIADATNLPLTVVSSTTAANTSLASADGSIETKGDTDYYKVSISTAGRYQFKVSKDTVSSSGLEDATLEIYSADGQLLYKNDDATSTIFYYLFYELKSIKKGGIGAPPSLDTFEKY